MPAAPKPKGPRGKQETDDYYRNFRTNVLLAWALSNGLLAVAILSGGDASISNSGSRQATYMLFILIFVAGMAGIVRRPLFSAVQSYERITDLPPCFQRFLASSLFLLITLFTGN